MEIFSIIKSILIQIFAFLVGVLILLVILLLAFPLFCLYIFRCGLKFYVKKFKTNFGDIVDTNSVVFTTDFDEKEAMETIVFATFFTGRIEIDQLRRSILNKILQKSEDGSEKYPELRQTLTSYFGYMFWKWDSEFDINNHVLLGYESLFEMNEDSLNLAQAKLLRKTFHQGRSPWEAFLIPKYVSKTNAEPMSLVLIRFSHAITDGLSIVEMISGEIKSKNPTKTLQSSKQHLQETAKPGTKTNVWSKNMDWFMLKSMLTLPFEIWKLVSTFDRNFLGSKSMDLKPVVVRTCKPIPVALIKELKNKRKCTFQGILLAAYTAGVRRLLLSSGIQVPKCIHCLIPALVAGHQDKLGNHMMYSFVSLPVGEKCPEKRLSNLTTQLTEQIGSKLPVQLLVLDTMYTMLPVSIYRYLEEITVGQSGIISTISAPAEFRDVFYNEHRWMGGEFSIAYNRGNYWFGINSGSFEDYVSIQTTHIDSLQFKGNENLLADGILEEIQYFANDVNIFDQKES